MEMDFFKSICDHKHRSVLIVVICSSNYDYFLVER